MMEFHEQQLSNCFGDYPFDDEEADLLFQFGLELLDDTETASTGDADVSTSDTSSCTSSYVSKSSGNKAKVKPVKARSSVLQTIVKDMKHDDSVKRSYTRQRPSKYKLYAFPVFDRSDSLLYFPTTLARYQNSSDFAAMTKLLKTHLDKDCAIEMVAHNLTVDWRALLKFYKLVDELHPDRMMCAKNTRVIENTIHCTMYKKFTACKFIYESVARTTKDKVFAPRMCQFGLKGNCIAEEMDEPTVTAVEALVDQADSFLVYMRIDVVITFDDMTKKIVSMHMKPVLQSVQPSDLDLGVPSTRTES